MKKLVLTAALGATCLVLAGCGEREETNAAATDEAAAGEAGGADGADGAADGTGTATASAAFPAGARIVEESGVTYRIDPDGTRIRLAPTESRIVVEDGTRFRVDPDGTRIRIDERGAAIDVDLPDVDVGINERGNPDVDVGDRDPDGGR